MQVRFDYHVRLYIILSRYYSFFTNTIVSQVATEPSNEYLLGEIPIDCSCLDNSTLFILFLSIKIVCCFLSILSVSQNVYSNCLLTTSSLRV